MKINGASKQQLKCGDSLRVLYRPEIAAGVSRGRFYGIMSHLGFLLQEVHTQVNDRGIDSSVIIDGKVAQPGIPVYFPGDYGITTAGMGVAPMPDSSLFVYRAQQGHPMGIQAGDIILGYDGMRWVDLLREIDLIQFPIMSNIGVWASHPEGYAYTRLICAPNNWHLYDVMDVVKFSTGDTVHLPEYASVLCYGTLAVVDEVATRRNGLEGLMTKYAPHLKAGVDYQPMPVSDIDRTSVFRMVVEERVAKHNVKPADYPAYPCPGESFIDAERNAGRVTMKWKEIDDGEK